MIINFPKQPDDHLVIDGGKTKDGSELFVVDYIRQGASIVIWSGPSHGDALAYAREVSRTDRIRIVDRIGGAR
ncbi:hypothetical+protein [Methylocapsa aurea]|uniref:hypothetical protein n=1 Tax=Methylocapsa aurea TaxID=663610 RepID=UPI003D18CFA1